MGHYGKSISDRICCRLPGEVLGTDRRKLQSLSRPLSPPPCFFTFSPWFLPGEFHVLGISQAQNQHPGSSGQGLSMHAIEQGSVPGIKTPV